MKKTIALLTGFVCIMGFASCSETDNSSESLSESSVTEVSETEPTTEEKEGKTLVVYFSATGNTKMIAEYIANKTNADLFEIQPVEPYSEDDLEWGDPDSRVSHEKEEFADSRYIELVETSVYNWKDYDKVFIGYPIWFGAPSWVMDGFIKANDFTDKTVIPYCTSSWLEIGETGYMLEEMAGTGNWLDGERFGFDSSEIDVIDWIDSLNLGF